MTEVAGGRPITARPLVPVCRLDDVPVDGCVAVAGGEVLLARPHGRLVAYRNRCLHRQARLDDGVVRDGWLTCAQHFWRYRLADGRRAGSDVALEPVLATVVEGEVHVELPPAPTTSVRQQLLEHARTWAREGTAR